MKNCNWMVTDINNKKADIIAHIKATTIRLSEDRIMQIVNVKSLDYNNLKSLWVALPQQFKSNNLNLGCA